jgi:hypothetical protein
VIGFQAEGARNLADSRSINRRHVSQQRTTQDHPTILGQYQRSQVAEAGALTKESLRYPRIHAVLRTEKSNFWLTAVQRADVRTLTHTLVGRHELAREWRVEMVLHRATSRPRWCTKYFRTAPGRPIWHEVEHFSTAANWRQRFELRV